MRALSVPATARTEKDCALDSFWKRFRNTPARLRFRHIRGWTHAVYERLKARNLALCVADSEKLKCPSSSRRICLLRLRDEGYTLQDIERWADTIRDKNRLHDGCVFQARGGRKGPEFARSLREALG